VRARSHLRTLQYRGVRLHAFDTYPGVLVPIARLHATVPGRARILPEAAFSGAQPAHPIRQFV